jgi:trimeric autotransporter adhesin
MVERLTKKVFLDRLNTMFRILIPDRSPVTLELYEVEEGRSTPTQAAQRVPTSYTGRAEVMAKLQSGAAPLAMASADFDGDGIADLVIGFATGGRGLLALHRGNLDAFAPQSYQSWVAIAHQQFPSPFLPQAAVIALPEAPDLLVTGDFNGDGHIDILTGARGSERLYLLTGNGKGKFSAPQAIALPGNLTALSAGEVGVRAGKSDVVAGIQTKNGAAVLVYKSGAGGLATAGVSYPVPQAVTQLELADLHGDGLPDVIALATEVFLIHPTGDRSADTSALVERVTAAGTPRAIAAGGLVWDRESRNELAVLSQSGVVQVLARGTLDTRQFTQEERFARRSAALRRQLPSVLKAPWSGQSESWNVVKSYGTSAPLTGNVRLMAVSLAHARPLDLVLVDSSDTRLHVLPANSGTGSADTAGGLMVETGEAPAAVLPMRVNVDGRRGLVMVGRSGPAPKIMAPLPDPTFTVNRNDDPVATTAAAATYCQGVAGDCSLREAVIIANSVSGADTIMLPAGTITLSQAGLGEDFAVTGDVDVRDDLTIVGSTDGSGNPTSIITGASGWSDKFISTNKIGDTDANLSISNVIFQNGNNTNLTSSGTFDYLGGAVDFFGCAPEGGGCVDDNADTLNASTLNITNVQFLNNTAAGCSAGNDCGGGLDSEFGSTTISGSLFSGNVASLGRGGALTLVGATETDTVSNTTFNGTNNAAQEGGALYVDFQNAAGTGSIGIHNSVFSNNTAGSDGGGIYVNLGSGGNQTTATIDQETVISGNSAATRGGGLVFFGISGSPNTALSLSQVTITGNAANGSSSDGGGGIFAASGGTLNLSFSRMVGNTVAATGKPTGISIEAGSGGSASIVNAADNWWGCNAGPSAAPCDVVGTVGGSSPTATVSPWLFLTLGANPGSITPVPPNNTSSLTADFLHDSSSGSVLTTNLNVLVGLPITFGATSGAISSPQATIQSAGTATATFTADTSCSQASVTATVDTNPAPTVTTPITVSCPDLTAAKVDNVSHNVTLGVGTWNWTVTVSNSSGVNSAPAVFGSGTTILTDTLPGGTISYGTPTAGSFSSITNSGNISCGIASSVLTCIASGASVTVGVGGGFSVTMAATATGGGAFVNPTGGSCGVDPNNTVPESNEGNNSCNSDSVNVVAPPSIAKAFSPTPIALNATTSLTFTITNPAANTVSLSGVGFSDVLPTGLTVASATTTVCGGTLTTAAPTGITLVGATIASGGQCTFSVTVTGITGGSYTNTTGKVTSTNGGTGNSATAALTVSSAAPTVVSLTPNTGTGASQTFAVQVSDLNGPADLKTMHLLFSPTSSNQFLQCSILYLPGSNQLYVFDDSGTKLGTPLTPTVAGTVSNSQCTLNGTGSSFSSSGNVFTLNVAVSFKPAFTGLKNAFVYAAGNSGLNTGWVPAGTWTTGPAAPPTVVSLTPNGGTGTSQTFAVQVSDPNGLADLKTVHLLFSPSSATQISQCSVFYNPATNQLYVYNDGNTALSAPLTPGAAGTVSNSQCTLSGPGSSVSTSGNVLTLSVAVMFQATFTGLKNAFIYAGAVNGTSTGWVLKGSWTGTALPLTVVSLTPNAGSGTSQTFSVVVSDPNGLADLKTVHLLFNTTSANQKLACSVFYNPANNQLSLYDDTGTTLSAPLTPGGTGTVSNSQCTLSATGSSFSTSGNSLSLNNVAITFTGTFTGLKNVYIYSAGISGVNTGWVPKGTWTP